MTAILIFLIVLFACGAAFSFGLTFALWRRA